MPGTGFRSSEVSTLETPDLQLTRSQVKGHWGLDDLACDLVLDALVQAQFLRLNDDGRYVRVESDGLFMESGRHETLDERS